jgi:phytanoyl-CoA hydroxylase
MKLTKNQIELFKQKGFLIIEDFYSEEEIEDFQNALKELIRAGLKKINDETIDISSYEGKEFDKGLVALESHDHFYVADIYDTLAQTTAFKRLTTKKETETAINQLMGREQNAPLYTFTCRCRIDPPKDNRRTYGWHQEVFYSIPESYFLQTWAPLVQNATKENGTIEVCVGSHANGVAPQSWNEIEGRALQIIVDEDCSKNYEQETIEIKVGSILIFDYRLFHRSGNNISNSVRYSLVGMYHDATNPNFYSANVSIGYKKKQPKEYFNEVFADKE